MRIAHLPSSYLPESLGGTEIYVSHLCRGLADLGHDSAVVWHTDDSISREWLGPEVQFRLPFHPPRRRADIYRRTADSEPAGFKAFLSEWKPDVIHFHAFTLGAGVDHARVAREVGIPYLVTYHTPPQSCLRGTMMRYGTEPCNGRMEPRRCTECSLQGRGWPKPLAQAMALSPVPWNLPDGPWIPRFALPSLLREVKDRWYEFFNGAARIVACAEFCRDLLLVNGLLPERVTVHRQALPGESRNRTLRLPIQVEAGQPLRLGFFGRFVAVKGPDLLIEAVRLLRSEGVNAVAELVGPIPDGEKDWADRMINDGGETTIYRGTLIGADLTAWLDQLDLVVIPSLWLETGPLTLLEAWDRGVPVIGSDGGGIRDFLSPNGLDDLLFPIGDAAGIAAAVHRALNWAGPPKVVTIQGAAELSARMAGLYAMSADGRE